MIRLPSRPDSIRNPEIDMNNTTSHQGRLKSLRAAGIGNALEWFDWTLYATATCEWVHGLMQADIYTVMITKNVLDRFLRNT